MADRFSVVGRKIVSILASSNGDGTGTTSATGDYSVTPLTLKYAPAANDIVNIHRVMISIEDSGALATEKYGALTALSNGITCQINDGTSTVDLTAFPVTTNGEWASHCHDVTLHSFGSGNSVVTIRWTFSKSGTPVILSGDDTMSIEFLFNDDFTGLVNHRFLLQGFYVDEPTF